MKEKISLKQFVNITGYISRREKERERERERQRDRDRETEREGENVE